MNFNILKHDTFNKWIPETDVDGVDADDSYVSEVSNAILGNGFIANSQGYDNIATPEAIKNLIHDDGYEILSCKNFYHSEQGDNIIYILWSDTANNKLVIYLNSIQLFIADSQVVDGLNNQWRFNEKPNNINYNVANDQLKINLNCYAFNLITNCNIMLNLTLCYLDSKEYNSTVKRSEGWYLVPRFLDWHYPREEEGRTRNDLVDFSLKSLYEIYTDLTNGFGDLQSYTTLVGGDSKSINERWKYISNSINQNELHTRNSNNQIVFTNVKLNRLVFSVKGSRYKRTSGSNNEWEGDLITSGNDRNRGSIKVYIYGQESKAKIYYISGDYTTYNIPLNMDYVGNVIIETIYGNSTLSLDGNEFIYDEDYSFNFIKLIFSDNYQTMSLIGVTDDGQRGLLSAIDNVSYGEWVVGTVTNKPTLRLKVNEINWRFAKYELYYLSNTGISTLIDEINYDNFVLSNDGTLLEHTINYKESSTTINNKYNLPHNEYVNYQRKIYSEVALKNRVYFVNGNYKVYQGHISSNLALQADCFPYNEEVGYGYFITSKQKINIALAISPTNDLVIFTNNGIMVYYIQASQSGTAYKTLKMLSNCISIIPNTLTKTVNNDSATTGLIWADDNGIYLYQGGVEQPINLIRPTHERWWKTLTSSYKTSMVGLYNNIDDEYWLRIGLDTLVFEIPYKRFNYKKGVSFNEFLGFSNGKIYYRTGSAVCSYPSTNYLSYSVCTHYNIAYSKNTLGIKSNDHIILSEINDKILQEIFIIFGQRNLTNVSLSIYIDDNLLGTYSCSTNRRMQKFLVPLGVRFNRIKFKVEVPNTYVQIKEIGCLFTPDANEPLACSTAGLDTGYGFTYGSNYGGSL